MKDFWIGIIILLFAGLFLWLQIDSGEIIWGNDNVSPFFSNEVNFHLIFQSGNFFEYGPIIYNWPVLLFDFLGFTPAWISYLNWLLPFSLGSYFLWKVISYLYEGEDGLYLEVLFLVLLLSNLGIIWFFSIPIAIFTSIYVAAPTLLYLSLKSFREENLVHKFLIFVGISYYFYLSLNLVAFVLVLIQVAILALFLRKVYLEEDSQLIYRDVSFRLLFVFGSWLILTQLFILLSNSGSFVFYEVFEHLKNINDTGLTETVTEDIRDSEMKNNTLLGVVRFATGWIELNDMNFSPIFNFYDYYMKKLVVALLGIIPICMALFVAIRWWYVNTWDEPERDEFWERGTKVVFLYFVVLFLISKYFAFFTGFIPYVAEGTRWLSSKLMPTHLVLTILVVLEFFVGLKNYVAARCQDWEWLGAFGCDLSRYAQIATIAFLLPLAYPWFSTSFFSEGVVSELPKSYIEAAESFSEDDKVLYLPGPQRIYFRQYQWGYYGSDFLSYMTTAEILGGGSIYQDNYNPQLAYESLMSCDKEYLEDFDYVVIDKSVVESSNLFEEGSCQFIDLQLNTQYMRLLKVSDGNK